MCLSMVSDLMAQNRLEGVPPEIGILHTEMLMAESRRGSAHSLGTVGTEAEKRHREIDKKLRTAW